MRRCGVCGCVLKKHYISRGTRLFFCSDNCFQECIASGVDGAVADLDAQDPKWGSGKV
jgi:hypothetical protein